MKIKDALMKKHIKNSSLLLLVFGFWLPPAGRATAQTFTNLHVFTATFGTFQSNTDGATPLAGLVLSGNRLYGTASAGGDWDNGTVFGVNIDGSGFTNLHNFTAVSSLSSNSTNGDGSYPVAGLIVSGNTLYGTAAYGGNFGSGTVFKVKTDGTDFTNLHSFSGTSNDGAGPLAGLIVSGNTLYGTTIGGGSSDSGVVFKMNVDGTGYTNLYSFTAATSIYLTNSDGSGPRAGLILSGDTLYGTTTDGGNPGPGQGSGNGTVFSLNTDGTGFKNLHNFTGGNDGADPYASLVLSSNILYGTTVYGGSSDDGTVFAVHIDGKEFTNLHSFTNGSDDGSMPYAALALSGGTLYGTTFGGGSGGRGGVFAINTDGTGFTNLYGFTGNDGGSSFADVIISENTFYGTTSYFGAVGNGTIFRLMLSPASPPQLTVIRSGTDLVFTWPASATGFVLQTNGDLTAANWNDYGGTITTNGDTESVTVTPSAGNLFFRLKQ